MIPTQTPPYRDGPDRIVAEVTFQGPNGEVGCAVVVLTPADLQYGAEDRYLTLNGR
jgi:hypothetical protein